MANSADTDNATSERLKCVFFIIAFPFELSDFIIMFAAKLTQKQHEIQKCNNQHNIQKCNKE